MARNLAGTLTHHRAALPSSSAASAARLLSHRHRSGRPDHQFPLIEFNVDAADSPSDPDLAGLRSRLEEAIHAVVARRAAPDWLPFMPGASYWVPPPPRGLPIGVVEVVGQIAAASAAASRVSMEEAMSVTSMRGWPSAAYFIKNQGEASHPAKRASKKRVTESEDEEAD